MTIVGTSGVLSTAVYAGILAGLAKIFEERPENPTKQMKRISRDFRRTIDKLSDDTLREAMRIRYGR